MNRFLWLLLTGCAGAILLLTAACGGGGSSSGGGGGGVQNPVPTISSISPSTAQAGSRAFTLTVTGSNFISNSVVQWGSASKTTTFVSSTQLTASITAADIASAGIVGVKVFNPAPGGGSSATLSFTITPVSPISILTTRLPNAYRNKLYSYPLQASGGVTPYTWSISIGSLPSGLTLSSSGVISGTPPAVTSDTTVSFSARVSDFASQPATAVQPLSIVVRAGSLGRNDTCPGAATPISNGLIRASISPYADVDVYSFQGTAGQKVTIETIAQRLTIYSGSTTTDVFLDSFLELLDSSCNQITYNDDISPGAVLDSMISDYTLPYTGTYYIRVSDLRGDGRPDFIYDLELSGAN